MTSTTHPTKEQLQEYLAERHESDDPPPSREEIRRRLGWRMTQPRLYEEEDERDL